MALGYASPPSNQQIIDASKKAYSQHQPAVDALTLALVNLINTGSQRAALFVFIHSCCSSIRRMTASNSCSRTGASSRMPTSRLVGDPPEAHQHRARAGSGPRAVERQPGLPRGGGDAGKVSAGIGDQREPGGDQGAVECGVVHDRKMGFAAADLSASASVSRRVRASVRSPRRSRGAGWPATPPPPSAPPAPPASCRPGW